MAKGVASIRTQLDDVMTMYNERVREAVDEAAKEASKSCVEQLRNTSPKKSGEYARGWTVKKERTSSGTITYTVHNRTDYQLTHLLENGHVIRNKKGTYGRTHPIKHIGPAADTAIQRFDLSARTRIGRIR